MIVFTSFFKISLLTAFTLTMAQSLLIAADDVPQILPIIEVRDGKQSVQGMEVLLTWFSLKDINSLSLIKIHEQKHNSDITNLMQISTTKNLSTIIIRFNHGTGDFGSGNIITVTFPPEALEPQRKNDAPLVFTLKTDD